MTMQRRPLLALAVLAPTLPGLPALAAPADPSHDSAAGTAADDAGFAALREGGAVLALRHALARGVYDPPGFRLGDCATQRNLSDEGRAQARRIGEAFARRGLKPAAVRSSPWCRCIDTATLAFGHVEPWAALGSPRGGGNGGSDGSNAAGLQQLRQALAAATQQPGRFEVWVTHMFLLSALAGAAAASGEGLVLRAAADGTLRTVGRISVS